MGYNKTAKKRASEALQGLSPTKRGAIASREARDIVALCRKYVPQALRVLRTILEDKKSTPRDRLEAVKILLDRAYGKAPQTTIHAVVGALSREQLETEVLAIMRRKAGGALVLDAKFPASGSPEAKNE